MKKEKVVGIISKSDFLYLPEDIPVHETDRFRIGKLRFKVKEIMHDKDGHHSG